MTMKRARRHTVRNTNKKETHTERGHIKGYTEREHMGKRHTPSEKIWGRNILERGQTWRCDTHGDGKYTEMRHTE